MQSWPKARMHRRSKIEGNLRRRRTARFARAEGVGLPEREARTRRAARGRAALKRVREENVGLMGRGDELWCVFVCVRVIFVSRRLAETRRVKRCAGVGANVAAKIDRQLKDISKHTDGDIQTRTPAHRFSRVSDSARRRALVCRPKG